MWCTFQKNSIQDAKQVDIAESHSDCLIPGSNSCIYANSEIARLAETGIHLDKKQDTSDKIRANVVRGLGNLSRIIDFDKSAASESNQLELLECILHELKSANDKVCSI